MRLGINSIACVFCLLFLTFCTNQDPNNSSRVTFAGSGSSAEDSSSIKLSSSRLTMYDGSLDTNDEVLPCLIYNKYEGKLVYVDIWATACYGCIEEIPFSKTLQQKLAHKNIAFVYLCCNSKPDVWQKIIHDHQLMGDHYFLNQKQATRLFKEFKILQFPRYMIFDPKGQLVIRDAPRPSSRNIVEFLNHMNSF